MSRAFRDVAEATNEILADYALDRVALAQACATIRSGGIGAPVPFTKDRVPALALGYHIAPNVLTFFLMVSGASHDTVEEAWLQPMHERFPHFTFSVLYTIY